MSRIDERISSVREANVSNLWLIRFIESFSRESRIVESHREVSRLTCFQRNQVLTHLESYTVADLVPETRICGEMLSNSVNRVEVETSRIIKKINMGNGTITREYITQEKINQETEYIKNPQKQYTDKVVDVIVSTQKLFLQCKRCTERVGQGNPNPVWISDTVSVLIDVQ